jgi:lipopolysaccharide transport protein LptA
MVLLAFIALNTAAGDAIASPDDIMMKKPSKPNKVSQKVEAPVDNEVKSLQAQNAQAEAEIKDLKEKLAAEKAAKEKAEKRVQYMLNPEPDERPLPKKEESSQKDTEEKADASQSKAEPMVKVEHSGGKKPLKKKKELTGREAVITADRTDYDRKEGIILFDRNVYVDDEQYQMHADRLFVFLDGTNDLKRLVAIGNVSITNEDKTASCARATYHKASHRIVMYGNKDAKARLHEGANKGSTVLGDRITFWLNSEQVEIEGPAVTLPGGAMKGKSPKDLLK